MRLGSGCSSDVSKKIMLSFQYDGSGQIGGCIEVLEFAKGIFQQAKGLIFAKPQNETYYEEYKVEILKVMKEYELEQIPILYNLNFGHTEPKFILPYGALAEINCSSCTFSIVDNGVQ